ncbi:MAG TPA: hypothetical protein DEH78_08290, partial [Solibacterales bacterium]|nr:hypothetical protein [Bryobacterales bacterium]
KIGGPLAGMVGEYLRRGATLPPGGVRDLDVAPHILTGAFTPMAANSSVMTDRNNRVLVDVVLAPGASLEETRSLLARTGARITGVFPYYRGGAISAYVPISATLRLAAQSGVVSVAASPKPLRSAGVA